MKSLIIRRWAKALMWLLILCGICSILTHEMSRYQYWNFECLSPIEFEDSTVNQYVKQKCNPPSDLKNCTNDRQNHNKLNYIREKSFLFWWLFSRWVACTWNSRFLWKLLEQSFVSFLPNGRFNRRLLMQNSNTTRRGFENLKIARGDKRNIFPHIQAI